MGSPPNPHGHPITAPKARSSKRSDGLCHAGSNVSSGTTFGNSKRKIQSTVWLCVYLSICLSVYLFKYLSILSIYLFTYLSTVSICLSIYLWIYPGESWGESWDSQGMEHHGMELWDRFNTFYHGKWPFIVCELEHGHRNSEFSDEKLWFSIVM